MVIKSGQRCETILYSLFYQQIVMVHIFRSPKNWLYKFAEEKSFQWLQWVPPQFGKVFEVVTRPEDPHMTTKYLSFNELYVATKQFNLFNLLCFPIGLDATTLQL